MVSAADNGRLDACAGEDVDVIDVVFVLLTVGLFVALALVARAVERL
ncbi:hypothetical protein [Plantactinospora sonchi]|uniref:Potassium-transporting ATPase n=1 Tax=Plantactinospora sonchi TaxID=1544735 RepID=A0ABU7RTJ5_9ACTN